MAKQGTKSELITKIYSQASNDVVIPSYKKNEDPKHSGPHMIETAIIIKGGANVAYSASNKMQQHTKWAVTEVNEDELETLKAHKGFMRRVDRGFITIGKEPEVIKADKSAQMTEQQLKAKSPKAKIETGPVGD